MSSNKNIVWKFTNGIELNEKEFCEYVERKFFKTIRRYELLKGYGKTFAGYGTGYTAAVVLVCDLDDKCLKEFRRELHKILNDCHPKPLTRFCIAIEEGEAWFLGDRNAIMRAYPNAKEDVLDQYSQDEICGTWELLADAIFPGGAITLSEKGYHIVGQEKFRWAENISPHMTIESNESTSFDYFMKKLTELSQTE